MLKTKILFITLTVASLFAEVVEDRNDSTSHDIMLGSRPSDIPTGGLVEDFRPMNKNLFTDVDISANPEAKLFAGYGIYDIDNSNCVEVDVPSDDGSLADSQFTDFKVYNDHTYAVSINDVTSASCMVMAAKYNGYPAQITTPEENRAVSAYFKDHKKWIGVYRDGPCPSTYIDSKGESIRYNGFYNESQVCVDATPNVLMDVDGTYWQSADDTETAKCVVEFDSSNWEKPVTTCAPWWSIERTYMSPPSNKYLVTVAGADGAPRQVDIRTFNQSDFPKSVKVCTQVDTNSTSDFTLAATREVVCNSYYDRTASPRCVDNPRQSLCQVDECRGSIKTMCSYISSDSAPLDYSKEPAFIDGEYKLIRKKVDIMMNKYRCPVQSAQGNCLEMQTVTMLPQVCPGTSTDSNGTEVSAIKVYGNPSVPGPNKYDGDGNLINLYGVCPDGQTVEVPVDILRQDNRICTEYSTITEQSEYDQMCTIDKGYTDHTVLTSMTELDSHQSDANCIRLNNITEARPRQDVRIDYQTHGMANLAIIKARIDESTAARYETLIPSLYYQEQIANMSFRDVTQDGTEGTAPALDLSGIPTINCSSYDNGSPDPFKSQLISFNQEGVQKAYDNSLGKLLDLGVLSKGTCSQRATNLGASVIWGADDTNATLVAQVDTLLESTYQLQTLTGISSGEMLENNDSFATTGRCVLLETSSSVAGDIFDYIEIASGSTEASPNMNLTTTAQYSYDSCRELAACSGYDLQNTVDYAGNQKCSLHLTATSGQAAMQEITDEIAAEIESRMTTVASSATYSQDQLDARSESGTLALDQIDGLSDIYAIMEYTDFNFGYFSSYSSRNFKSNDVKVNGFIVHPIAPHVKINEHVNEYYSWNYTKYRNYSLDWFGQNTMFVGAGGGVGNVNAGTVSLNVATLGALTSISLIYNAIFGKDTITFNGNSFSEVYGYLDPSIYRYIENPYGYETRAKYQKDGETYERIKYFDIRYSTGGKRMDMGMQSTYFNLWKQKKKAFYEEMNIDMDGYVWPAHDTRVLTSNPDGCDWWDPWCKKSRSGSGSGILDPDKYHDRDLTVHYMGATNSVSIVVPYKGNYSVKAYNRLGMEVGSFLAYESSFVTNTRPEGDTMAYAQVKFGESMALSPGLNGDACRTDLMVEIGGGVSGAYYEHGKTATSSNFYCSKSNDQYVIDNSIVKLTITPVGQSTPFVINLKKPMPYANRVFLTSMQVSEERVYRCYDNDFAECIDFQRTQYEN